MFVYIFYFSFAILSSKFRAKLLISIQLCQIIFRFKQFTVFQQHCAMKVGTDGVLLGAWANVARKNHILDIGTGTGLIALMLAQRNEEAQIKAIDIDKQCILQAHLNVHSSPFANRINVEKESFQEYAVKTNARYDLIVSNPPYFQNALKSPCQSRNQARHNDTLSFFEIISQGTSILNEDGRIVLILPHEFKQQLLDYASKAHLLQPE